MPTHRRASERPKYRSFLLICFLCSCGFVVATGSLAYKIVLKDGTAIDAAEPYRVEGGKAVFELLNGSTSTLPLSEIDTERTEAANRQDLGDAVVINRDGTTGSYDPNAVQRSAPVDTLRSLLQQRAAVEASSTAAETPASGSRVLRKTSAGYPDFSSLTRVAPTDANASQRLSEVLASTGLNSYSLFEGSAEGRILVEITSETEKDVLDQLSQFGAALFDYLGSQDSVQVVEIFMRTGSLSRAGQFEMDRDAARLLAQGRVTPREFFVANVQF